METEPAEATRGGNILWSLTYQQIADWTGLKLNSVRTYANRKHFKPKNIDSVLCWVNQRRSAKGWPLIGVESVKGVANTELDTLQNSNAPPSA